MGMMLYVRRVRSPEFTVRACVCECVCVSVGMCEREREGGGGGGVVCLLVA